MSDHTDRNTRRPLRSAIAGVIVAPLIAAGAAEAAETYVTNQGHTEVIFGWSHAGVSMQHGEFTKAEGVLTLDRDNLENSSISVTIDTSSVSTGVTALDDHLKRRDYLDVQTYPTITFESTKVEPTGDKTADVTGDLTIHGVTKPTTLKVTLTHIGTHPVAKWLSEYKGNWVAFSAETTIRHQKFKVGAYPAGPTDKIKIQINTEMKQQE